MRKILNCAAVLLLAACSAQSYLDEGKGVAQLPFTVSYDTTDEGVEMTWVANWDNTRFEVLRGTNEAELAPYETNVAQTFWVDTQATPGMDYFYEVNAYNQKNRLIGHAAPQRGYRSYQNYATMEAPIQFVADQAKFGDRITLYWYGQKQSRFSIYRSPAADGDYQKIAEVGGVSYADTNVQPGQVWYYKISSVGKDFTVTGASRTEDTLKPRFYNSADNVGAPDLPRAAYAMGSASDAPIGIKATDYQSAFARSGAVQVSWQWDSKADYYKIYRSASEDGDYQLIAPYSRSFSNIQGSVMGLYTDRGLPATEGYEDTSVTPSAYKYPVYYYRISAIKNNQESAQSAVAIGGAVDSKDVLPAPENFSIRLKTVAVAGFDSAKSFPALAGGNYTLVLSWDKLPAAVTSAHSFIIIGSNTVSGVTNRLNPLALAQTATSYEIPNPAFNEELRYFIYAENTGRGGLQGNESTSLYKSLTPLPPAFASASTLKRVEETNEVNTNAPTFTQYKTGTGTRHTYPGTGVVTKVWTTTAKVGDIELKFTPAAPNSQQSYNIYRRKKTAGNTETWVVVTNVAHKSDADDAMLNLEQAVSDFNFTAAQYQGEGSVNTAEAFYPKYEYRIAALNGSRESAPTALTKEGQAINPADILPAPSYLSVPFHYAEGTGLAFWSFGWTVTANGGPTTTGFNQVVGKSGGFSETQRIFVTWDAISVPGGSFDYRFRHVRSAFAALDSTQYPEPDYLQPSSWYTHGGVGTTTWVKLNNETSSESMTYLYDVVDSGIAGIAGGPAYNPGAAFFAVSATNKNAGGLDGNTIGIYFQEPTASPYGSRPAGPKNLAATLDTGVYPYQLKFSWDKVSGAGAYNVYVKTDGGDFVRIDTNPGTTTGDVSSYSFAPDTEFVLGGSYTYYVQSVEADGSLGETSAVTYNHVTPYRPIVTHISTNRVTYSTNTTAGGTVTWISNDAFADTPRGFSDEVRNVGEVIKEWAVTASGGTVELQLSYGRPGTLPQSYKIYRSTVVDGTPVTVTVPVNAALMGATTFIDTVAKGKYYYKVSAIYSGKEGSETPGSEDNVGASLDTAKLSPAPSYLTVPFHWSFGTAGYTAPVRAIPQSPLGIAQLAGENGGGQALWLTWSAPGSGSAPAYTVRLSQGSDEVLSSADVLLANGTATKLLVDNHAGTGKTALYSSSETSRNTYNQGKAAFDVAVANSFTDALGNAVTVTGGSRGIVFYESSDPYTDDNLAPPASVTVALDKEAYIDAGHYNLNITWPKVDGAGAYTLYRRPIGGGADTLVLTTNAPASNPSSYTYAYNANGLGLGNGYEFVVVSTNLSPVKKGDSNYAAYTHNTPKPVRVTGITTNDQTESTNDQAVAEDLTVYYSSTSMKTGRTLRRWHITQPNKGIITLNWVKLDGAEPISYYKVYRTTAGNNAAPINASHDPSTWAGVGVVSNNLPAANTSLRDDTMATMSASQRRGIGVPVTQYPVYYYRITAVKNVGGVEYESLPSVHTNGALLGGVGGSAINPEDVYASPTYVNVVFDYSKTTGWGNILVKTGGLSPAGIELFGSRTRGSFNYPPNPLWVAWGVSTNASGATNAGPVYWVRDHFRSSSAWPGWSNFATKDLNYSGSNPGTTYKSSQAAPTANRIIEYSNSDSLNGGNPVSTLYDISTRTGGVGFEVSTVNTGVNLDGVPLKGESRGLWYHQTSY